VEDKPIWSDCDNVIAFNIVLPNATMARIDESQCDLFFSLKGGFNRFGIVTSIEFKTQKQVPTVYGGIAQYTPGAATRQVINATQEFYATNTDSKAQIITTVNGEVEGSTSLVLFFYDGPTRPALFKPFNNIPTVFNDIRSQTFSTFVSSVPSELSQNIRGTFNTISTSQLTLGFLAAVYNETKFYGASIALHAATTIAYDIEPFLQYGKYASDSAYPHASSPLPLNIYFAWIGAENDQYWYNAIHASTSHLKQVAINEGIYPSDSTAYPNYAVSGISATDLYDAANAARLASVRQQIDPNSVMEPAGGFPIQNMNLFCLNSDFPHSLLYDFSWHEAFEEVDRNQIGCETIPSIL
jgi:hypothetical protein